MTSEEIDELEVTEINDFTQISAITGDENFHVQTPAGNNLACMISQIAGYAFQATCNSAANAATKVVVITGYHGTVLPQLVAVTFTNGNTYGDVTASPETHPYIQFKNADNVNLGNARDLCDCRGNYAGTGCIKAGNIIYLSTIGTKTLMINHDIRQQTGTMTIKADGSFKYKERRKIIGETFTQNTTKQLQIDYPAKILNWKINTITAYIAKQFNGVSCVDDVMTNTSYFKFNVYRTASTLTSDTNIDITYEGYIN